jgi:serine protease Do
VISIVVILLIAGALFRTGLVRVPAHLVYAAPSVAVHVAPEGSPASLADFRNGFSSVIDPALPAVVNISSTKIVKQPPVPNVFQDPFFRQFFGEQLNPQQQRPENEREHSLGSGVIVNPDGYILTNNHVISGASDIEVFTQSQNKYRAKVVGADPRTDVAVIKIDASGLPSLSFADSSKLKVGDIVFAIGDPFGIGETATMGIVSATGRGLGGVIEHYEDFIQTDAPINPGNSGGALIDLRGNLVGINTAIISGGEGGGNEGVGFAIPVDLAHNIMDQIVEHGKVIRGYLGVSIQNLDPDMAKAFGLSHGGGALVGDVTPGSPGAKAGLERGDIILQLNGTPVIGPDDLSLRISEMAPGAQVHLQVHRNGQSQNIDVTLGAYPEQNQRGPVTQGSGAAVKGLNVQNLTPDISQQLGLPAGSTGVVVTSVDAGSAADAAGIQQGDIIQEVDRKPVHSVDEYQRAIAGLGNQPILLLMNSKGTTHYVVLEPEG